MVGAFLAGLLVEAAGGKVEMYTTPPMRVFKGAELELALFKLGLVPAANIRVRVSGTLDGSVLKEEVT